MRPYVMGPMVPYPLCLPRRGYLFGAIDPFRGSRDPDEEPRMGRQEALGHRGSTERAAPMRAYIGTQSRYRYSYYWFTKIAREVGSPKVSPISQNS